LAKKTSIDGSKRDSAKMRVFVLAQMLNRATFSL
jgi:hypothetical protein